ncbi:MAG: RAMP superfamily CRISPR-associated protein [Verrucomicrobia bacterium]|nr:RAMP superfamily CRISPR-associated protein [Verrucomicrobiota bacterium]
MPTWMPADTRAVLGPQAEECKCRSLFLDRFASPAAKDSGDDHPRRDWFAALLRKPAEAIVAASRQRWMAEGLPATRGTVFYAQLQSRLLVNMAGGVMENAGLSLDRFGLPYIPGSAVKGCARRAATDVLAEADSDDGKAELLFNLALVFGWGDTDWRAGRKRKRRDGREVETEPHSDFWWAMSPDTGNPQADDGQRNVHWHPVAFAVANRLLNHLRITQREYPEEPWRDLPNSAGSVSFLPAYPLDLGKIGEVDGLPLKVPALGKLELDVVTCHHQKYYAGPENPNNPASVDLWQRQWGTAPDIEEPNPVVFPAVAPGHIFTFALVPLRGADGALLKRAREWLQIGLQTFGLGAKTNAGYGWFDACVAVQETIHRLREDRERQERMAREREEADRQRQAREEELTRQKKEREAALAGLSGDERVDREIALLTGQQFDAKVRAFCRDARRGGPTDEQRKAIVRALRGPRLDYWRLFKTKATRGELATVDQSIRQLSKHMFPGQEGKMP